MRIIIFGTGYFGKALYQKLLSMHSVVAFASNYIREGEDTLSVTIYDQNGKVVDTVIKDSAVVSY